MPEILKLTSVSEALKIVHSVELALPPVERVPVERALGRVLAEEAVARDDVPGFYRSTMDGFAVRAQDTFGASEGLPAYLDVAGEVLMGRPAEMALAPYQAVRVATGGMLPAGADAVVMVEYAEDAGPGQIGVVRPVAPGENVVTPGEDIRAGALLLPRGAVLRPQDLGALAGVGAAEVAVYGCPVVAVLSTGDEVVAPAAEPGPGQVRDINSFALAGLVEQAGATAKLFGIIKDDFNTLRDNLDRALAEADMVLLSGGSSVGEKDMTPKVIDALGAPGVLIHGVAVKPGKPTIFGMAKSSVNSTAPGAGNSAGTPKPVFGLPGHPVSTMVLFDLLVHPILRRLSGALPPREKPQVMARIARNVPSAAGRKDYIRVALTFDGETWWAEPVLGRSGLITTMVRAAGMVEIAEEMEGLLKGQDVAVKLF